MLPEFSERKTDGTVPFRIRGGDLATVEFAMAPGDTVFAEPGSLVGMHGGVDLDVEWGDGLIDPIRRVWAGEKATLQEFHCKEHPGNVVLGAPMPGRVIRIHLDGQKSLFCDRGAYLAHTGNIRITVGFSRRVRAGLLGGNGFVMQRLTGYGDVFLHAMGSIIDWSLPKGAHAAANRRNLLAFEDTVGYDIQFAGGFWSSLFGGQGLFLVRLQGPGRVVLHSIDQTAFRRALQVSDRKERVTTTPAKSGTESK